MAVDIHLEFTPELQGESKVKGFEGKLQLESAGFGVSNSADPHAGGGAGSGKSNFQDLHCTMYMDKASSTLFIKCADGTHFEKALLTLRKAGGEQEPFLKYEMSEKVFVTSYHTSSGGGDDRQMISFSLAFGKIAMS